MINESFEFSCKHSTEKIFVDIFFFTWFMPNNEERIEWNSELIYFFFGFYFMQPTTTRIPIHMILTMVTLNMAWVRILILDSIRSHKCRLVQIHLLNIQLGPNLCKLHLYFTQGDLDRQRLLGNRQRIGLYESNNDDGDCEGLEHQERWVNSICSFHRHKFPPRCTQFHLVLYRIGGDLEQFNLSIV